MGYRVTEYKIERGKASPAEIEALLNRFAEDGWGLASCPHMERPSTWQPSLDPYLYILILERTR